MANIEDADRNAAFDLRLHCLFQLSKHLGENYIHSVVGQTADPEVSRSNPTSNTGGILIIKSGMVKRGKGVVSRKFHLQKPKFFR